MILGRFKNNQPINTLPTKSKILPKNPLVVFLITLPVFLIDPEIPDASNNSSFDLLLSKSLFLANILEDIEILCLSTLILSSKLVDIDSDISLAPLIESLNPSKDLLILFKFNDDLMLLVIRYIEYKSCRYKDYLDSQMVLTLIMQLFLEQNLLLAHLVVDLHLHLYFLS